MKQKKDPDSPGDEQPQHPAAPAGGPEAASAPAGQELLPLRGLPSLLRLRDRIDEAARELNRLREENAALAERLTSLERRAAEQPEVTTLDFEDDPEVLRTKITSFIEAIDEYLAREGARD